MMKNVTIVQRAAPYFSLIAIGIATAIAVLALPLGIFLAKPSVVYMSCAFLAFAIPAIAGLARDKEFDVFEPINLIALALFFGTSVRAIYLITSDSQRAAFVMMGTDFEHVAANAPWMVLSVAALTVGYLIVPWRVPLERLSMVKNYGLSLTRFAIATIVSAAISFVGLAMLVLRENITLSGGVLSLSKKRVAQYIGDDGQVIYGTGYEAFLGLMSQYAVVLLACVIMAGLIRLRATVVTWIVVLVVLACATPFLISSRSTIVVMFLSIAIAAIYYNKLRASALVAIFVLSIPLVVGMGYLRQVNQTASAAQASWAQSPIDSIIGSGNSIDFVRTSAIIDRVPEVRPFQDGWSYIALFTAPIPRAVWPEKPNPSLGPWVKKELFGQNVRNHGWPPGMIAEGYINFGLPGMIISMFLFGALLKVFYDSCRPLLGVSLPITAIYAVSVWRLGFGTIGLNFAQGMMQALGGAIPMVILLILARAPVRRGSAPRVRYA